MYNALLITIPYIFTKLTYCIILYTWNQRTPTHKEENWWHNWTVVSCFGGSLNYHWHWIGWPRNHCLFSSIFFPSKCNHRRYLWFAITWFITKRDFHIWFCFCCNGQFVESCSYARPNHMSRSQRSSLWHHENSEGLQYSGIVISELDNTICFSHTFKLLWVGYFCQVIWNNHIAFHFYWSSYQVS